MGTIRVQNLELLASHGAYHTEKQIKQRFIINILLELDFEEAAREDDLHQTVNYEKVVTLCREVMDTPASLLETLARRLAHRLKDEFPEVKRVEISISKPEVQLAMKLYDVSVQYSLP